MAFNPISIISATAADGTFSTLGATVHNAGVTNILTGNAGRFILEGAGPVVGDDAGATFTGTGATFAAILGGSLQVPKINDSNGAEVLGFVATTSAVNFFTLTNQASGSGGANGPTIASTGTDSSVDFNFDTKGTSARYQWKINGTTKMDYTDIGGGTFSLRNTGGLFAAGGVTIGSNQINWNADNFLTRAASGSLTLGTSGGGTQGSLSLATLTAGTSVVPSSNGAASLGSAAVGFKSLYLDYTNTATVGAVTINKPSGRVIMGAGGTTFTLTNSLITAASHIFLSADSAPGNVVAVQFYAVPAAGSCTINAVPAVTNQTNIDFFICNAD